MWWKHMYQKSHFIKKVTHVLINRLIFQQTNISAKSVSSHLEKNGIWRTTCDLMPHEWNVGKSIPCLIQNSSSTVTVCNLFVGVAEEQSTHCQTMSMIRIQQCVNPFRIPISSHTLVVKIPLLLAWTAGRRLFFLLTWIIFCVAPLEGTPKYKIPEIQLYSNTRDWCYKAVGLHVHFTLANI